MAYSAADPVVQDRRAGGHAVLERFVSERAEMLSQYWKVAGLSPYDDVDSTSNRTNLDIVVDLRRFCEVLVDYIAAGHFVLYERIASGQERRRAVAELARSLYPRISELTETVVRFNDKYDKLVQQDAAALQDDALVSLDGDLSTLGETLAVRIELEDQLIAKLMEGRG